MVGNYRRGLLQDRNKITRSYRSGDKRLKSPGFTFYPKQWIGDNKVLLMDWDVKGMHAHLMFVSWQEDEPGTLPKK